ncbi:surface protease GP63, putative, partial [Trypanosoma cruzi marinkellei]
FFLFSFAFSSHSQAALLLLLLLTIKQEMQFTQAMRQPRHATPPLPLVVLLLMYCASGCIAADPALAHRRGFDAMMGRSGPLPTAVVREVPRKGQGAMQAYTVASQDDDDSAWRPIRIEVSTEELEKKIRKKKYCEKKGETCVNVLGHEVTCEEGHVFSDEKKELYTKKILPGAVKLHSERLLVKPTGTNIEVPRNMDSPCEHFTIPTDLLKKVFCLMLTLSSTPLLGHRVLKAGLFGRPRVTHGKILVLPLAP